MKYWFLIRRLTIVFLLLISVSPSYGIELIDALQQTLKKEPNIKLQELTAESKKAAYRSAGGAFDLTFYNKLTLRHTNTPLTKSIFATSIYDEKKSISDALVLTTSLSRKMRSSRTYVLSTQITRSDDQTDYISGHTIPTPTNSSTITFSITQPLMRGFGREATTAAERAAKLEYKASSLDLNQTILQRIMATLQSYWNYVYYMKRLEVLKLSEVRTKTLINKTKKLINIGDGALTSHLSIDNKCKIRNI